MATERVYRFEFFDDVRQRWVRARYVATQETLAVRYTQWRLVGEPILREVPDSPPLGIGYARPPD